MNEETIYEINKVVPYVLLAVAILLAANFARKFILNALDRRAIYRFLQKSYAEGTAFRSTAAIAAATRLSDVRVVELAYAHPHIVRNQKERQTWRIKGAQPVTLAERVDRVANPVPPQSEEEV